MTMRLIIEPIVRAALLEDLGRAGDITTDAMRAGGREGRGSDRGATSGCGRRARCRTARVRIGRPDIAHRAQSALTAPGFRAARWPRGSAAGREACSRLSAPRSTSCRECRGSATATRALADAVAGYKARIVCTRKTTPGLRTLERRPSASAGAPTTVFGLDDAMLIKDNHIALAGGVRPALERARRHAGHLVKIELEVDTLDQLAEALEGRGRRRAARHMTPETMAPGSGDGRRPRRHRSVRADQSRNRPIVAGPGVDLISSGWITHQRRQSSIWGSTSPTDETLRCKRRKRPLSRRS